MAHRSDDLETVPELPTKAPKDADAEFAPGMVVLYAADDIEHIGAWISAAATGPARSAVFGRGIPQPNDGHARLKAVRQRPGTNAPLAPFASPSLSREQLLVRALDEETLDLTNVGRLPLAVNGQRTKSARVQVGDVLEIGTQLVLLVASRPTKLRAEPCAVTHSFGEADAHGYVGESPAAWQLRGEVAFVGPLPGHVVIAGPSGTGKELVATALHDLSGRDGPLVSRNAATFPESLVDAELFGNLKGYPNPGMPERKGLVGTAHGGSLFLDEFAELAPGAQAKLLRVLDCGEYQTLGESRARRSDFRLIAATNRPEASLRSDLVARFDLRLRTPPLSERREDLPLLAAHLLRTMTDGEPALRERVFDGRPWPLLDFGFVTRMVRADFPANVRELRALLWRSVSKTRNGALKWPDEVPASISCDDAPYVCDEARKLERVLEENGGSIEKSWRALGLSSRYAMMRLLRKHGVTMTRRTLRD